MEVNSQAGFVPPLVVDAASIVLSVCYKRQFQTKAMSVCEKSTSQSCTRARPVQSSKADPSIVAEKMQNEMLITVLIELLLQTELAAFS
jgi:hypothetical protein